MTPPDSTQTGTAAKVQENERSPGARLLLICHGEGMEHRYAGLGNMNTGLTAHGWEEVEALAVWLSTHESVRALYSGPLLQSRLTAQRIGQAVHAPVSVLREPIHLLADEAGAEAGGTNGNAAKATDNGGGAAPSAQGGSLAELLAGHEDGCVALVASPDNIRAMLRRLLGANDTYVCINHTSLTALLLRDHAWAVEFVNRSEHLPAPERTPAHDGKRAAEDAKQEEDVRPIVAVYNRVASEDVTGKASDDRARIETLLDFAALPPDLEILDAGTGLGVLALMLAEDGAASVYGVDVSPRMLEQAELLRLSNPTDTTSSVSYRLGRVQALPFPDESFDVVTCRLLLNHFQKPERVVREFVRVLRPGGIFLMAELLSEDDPVKRATQNAIEERRNPSHVAARSAEQYDKMVTNAGLEIEKTATVSITRDLQEWLKAYRTPDAVAATVIEMVEAGLETDAAGIGARQRGDRIEFVQRVYYVKAIKPAE